MSGVFLEYNFVNTANLFTSLYESIQHAFFFFGVLFCDTEKADVAENDYQNV